MVLGTSLGSSGWVSVSQGLGDQGRDWGPVDSHCPTSPNSPPTGHEALHSLTKPGDYSLRVDLRAGDEAVFAQYDSFQVDSADEYYRLHLEGYHGTAGEGSVWGAGRESRERRGKDLTAPSTPCQGTP